jgi:hypothetical protein
MSDLRTFLIGKTPLSAIALTEILKDEGELAALIVREVELAEHLKRHFLLAAVEVEGDDSFTIRQHCELGASLYRLIQQFELDETHAVVLESLLEMGRAIFKRVLTNAFELLRAKKSTERCVGFARLSPTSRPELTLLLARVPSCACRLFEAVTAQAHSFVRPPDETAQLIDLLSGILEVCPILDLSVFRWFGGLVQAEQECLARYIAAGPDLARAKNALNLLVECKKMNDFYLIGVSIDREAACLSVRGRSFEQVASSVKQEWMVTLLEFLEETEEEQEGSELSRAADYLRG